MKPLPFARIVEGEEVSWRHTVTAAEVDAFVELSGDLNPLHLDDAFARQNGFRGRVVHGMLVGAFLSRVLGTVFPGPGVLWLSQTIRFQSAVYVDETIEVTVRIAHKSESLRTLVLETSVLTESGASALTGEAKVMMLQTVQRVEWNELVAVVTGGGRGIGAAVARAFGEKGARVVVNYRERLEPAQEVVAAIEEAGGEAFAAEADVGTTAGAESLARAALGRFGRVDVLVNNATPAIDRKPLLELEWEEVDRYWRTYVQSAFTLTHAFVPGMRDRGFGRIIHLLTTAMWGAPPPGTAGYVAAKSGLWGLAKAMAVELAPLGITVNAVSPSAVLTEQWDATPDNRRRAMGLRIPAQRLARADEVASTVVYLASNEAAYVTGANFPVAGGEVM
ncbi:MAG: SDR family oxidoreductase [Gaiellaceae bacterium MAG52_C11]|nr:SDR family oxidoreductase [Candidatus Gaiellasilicea maunaloa]